MLRGKMLDYPEGLMAGDGEDARAARRAYTVVNALNATKKMVVVCLPSLRRDAVALVAGELETVADYLKLHTSRPEWPALAGQMRLAASLLKGIERLLVVIEFTEIGSPGRREVMQASGFAAQGARTYAVEVLLPGVERLDPHGDLRALWDERQAGRAGGK